MWVCINDWFDMAAQQWTSKPVIWLNTAMVARVYIRDGDEPGAIHGEKVLEIRQMANEYPLYVKFDSEAAQALLAAIQAESIGRVARPASRWATSAVA